MPSKTTQTKDRPAASAFFTIIVGSGKRRWLVFCVLIFIFIAFLFVFVVLKEPKSDDEKYHRLVSAIRLEEKFPLDSYNWLPRVIVRPLNNLIRKPILAYNEQEPFFIASGYLTNVTLTFTNALKEFPDWYTSDRYVTDIDRRLQKAAPNDLLPSEFTFNPESNAITIKVTCPAKDVSLLQSALQKD